VSQSIVTIGGARLTGFVTVGGTVPGGGGGGPITHASTTGQTPDDHHARDHAATHGKGAADPLTVEDLSTASNTLTHVLAPDGAGGLTMRAEAGGGTNKIACCPFGAKSDGLGKFLIANGKSSDADDSTKPKTRQPIGLAGTLTYLVYQTKEATSTTEMRIHISGSVEATVTLANINANFGGVESISISVAAGDYVEIEYESSDKPGECTMYLVQETA
jgi:hypothetical protein